MFGDGRDNPPYGLFGGGEGSPNMAWLNQGLENERLLKSKESVNLGQGETYTSYPSGGGGWGDPAERDPGLVRLDAMNEIISLEAAEKIYKVVLEGDDLRINETKTAELRR